MRKLTRILFGLSVFLVLGSLSACGQSHSTASKQVTITFWHGMTGIHQQDLNAIVHDFNQSQTTYKVVASSQGDFGNVQQKIMAAAKSKTLPTMAQTTYTNLPDYVQGDFVVPLNGYVTSKTMAQIDPVMRESSQYRGKTYALPFSKSARVLFYNQGLLKKLHLSVPKTWTQLQQTSRQAKAHGLIGLSLDQDPTSEISSILHSETGHPILSANPQLTSKPTVQATHVITDMFKDRTAVTAGTDYYGNVRFLKGKTLFYTGSSAAIPVMQANAPKGLHWQAAPLPSYHGKSSTPIAGNDLVLFNSASTAQRRGVGRFMNYLLREKHTLHWAKASGYLPLTTAALKSRNYRDYMDHHPANKAAVMGLKSGGYQDTAFLGYSRSFAAFNDTMSQLSTLKTTPEKALAQLQPKTEQILKQAATN